MENTSNFEFRYNCPLCKEKSQLNIFYNGDIRSGGLGSPLVSGYKVLQCGKCDLVFLDKIPANIQEFYEGDSYRENFDYQIDVVSLQKKFDHEQNSRISRIGVERMRGKVVADFGCGPGIFIDAIARVAGSKIVVEPSIKYREFLSARGHRCFSYAHELLQELGPEVDIAVSFDAVEHVPDCLGFIESIHASLKPGGYFYLSMPNIEDMLRFINPEKYNPFYFQVSHVNYFSAKTAANLLSLAGFVEVSIDFLHKYKIENVFRWLSQGSPGAFNCGEIFDRSFHDTYVANIERLGISSHLFLTAKKSPL